MKKEVIDETVGDVVIAVGLKNVDLKVELVGWNFEEWICVSVWIDVNKDEEIEVDLGVDWEEVIDETVKDVVIVDGIRVVGL